MGNMKVKENPADVVQPEVLASAIRDIGAAARKLAASGLNRKAVVVLVADASKVSRSTVGAVLDALATLERDYCR